MDPRLAPGGCRHLPPCLPPRASLRQRDRVVDYELAEMAVLLRTGELSAEQLAIAYLARLYEFEDRLRACGADQGYCLTLHIDAQQALTRARLADQWLNNPDDPRGPAPVLCGIVLGIRESLAVPARRNSPWRLADSSLATRLLDQGAVLLGPLRDPTHAEGNAAGLSAISPVARLCAAALGETADEAFMIPTAAHGASGIKPSLGLAMGWDVPGSIARSVRDAALVLEAITGSPASTAPVRWPVSARDQARPLTAVRIGVPCPTDTLGALFTEQILQRLYAQLAELGAQLVELAAHPQSWDAVLAEQALDFILLLPQGGRLPNLPGWPMVTFPVGLSADAGALNAAFCGPHLSDAALVQAALDFQAHYPQYHDSAPLLRLASAASAITAPRMAWPTG
ncbi:hypothetical protein RRX38_14850 [Pseudomonas sp. DTU_2021_1001937_2_SI_NGA_ILE_001]|uniref:amidase family protein n=1 Tax=Pseudomonas sp. DTU_2021_1001937_2_SI_NGA_ILE_001 TaxID=3077589 RepID=UPI0028FC1CBA|nr:amidase family protein [Pseudomonas sp. DTU_2021_1001937_2_SI_NGA_ILE_001]WNW12372.1 hypothetical protein RRX38_14850 [Pseudomonas sp. DTU_2021_1001937_2_SI_NGA_ILE_001]